MSYKSKQYDLNNNELTFHIIRTSTKFANQNVVVLDLPLYIIKAFVGPTEYVVQCYHNPSTP